MNSIEFLSVEKVVQSINDVQPSDLVFWVGAGIDVRYPTCLPLGDSLRSKILNMSIGDTLSSSIDKEWNSTYKKLATILENRVWLPRYQRLETIIDCIQDFETNLLSKDASIIKGLTCFSDIEPNLNHFVLAHYLLQGASIVTTNYENCIIKAYNEITDHQTPMVLECTDLTSSVYIFSGNSPTSGKLFYLHGIAAEPNRIGISLSSIKKGLGNAFTKQFKSWIESGKTLIYIGYSGSDSLDVTPMIMECTTGDQSTAIYFKHISELTKETAPNVLKVQANEALLLKPFGKKFICADNTKKLFDLLGTSLGMKSEDEPDCKENWVDSFQERATKYHNEKLYYTLATRILFELNINTKNIIESSKFELAENYNDVSESFINYYCFRAAHLQGDKKNMRKYAERYVKKRLPILVVGKKLISNYRENSMVLDFYTASGIGINAFLLHKKPSKVNLEVPKEVSPNNIIPWAPISQYNRFLSKVIILISILPCFTSVILKISRSEIENLIETMTQMVKLGYSSVVSVNQINISLRALGLARILLEIEDFDNDHQLIEDALQNYANTSHMHGISTTLLFSSYSYSMNYLKTKNMDFKELALHDLEYAARITQITDDKTMISRLVFAKHFLKNKLHIRPNFRIKRSLIIFDE